jgi:hypothetical protein
MNHCQHDQTLLLEAAAGRVTPDSLARIMACPHCAELLAEQTALLSTLDDFAAPEAPLGFDARLRARIAAEARPSFWERLRIAPLIWRTGMPALALCGAVLCVMLLDRQTDRPLPTKAKVNVTEGEDVQALENALDDIEMLNVINPLPAPLPARRQAL